MSWKTRQAVKAILAAEEGTIIKDWGGKTSIALVYPNTYYVGMSNLGVHTVYRIANSLPNVVCERVFLPPDFPSRLVPTFVGTHSKTKSPQRFPEGKLPVLSVESQRPLGDFDIVAFSVAFENDIPNIKTILERSNIPPPKEERRHYPRLIAGGAAVRLNPEAFREVFDGAVTDDAENALPQLLQATGLMQQAEDGPAAWSLKPEAEFCPAHSIIWTHNTEFGSMHLVEVERGCPWRCKFCAAPVIYQPYRRYTSDAIINAINVGLSHRSRIGLIGGDVLGHPDIEGIIKYIHGKGAQVSPSSLRADRMTPKIAALLKESGLRQVTLAPETGSESLRKEIGKPITDEGVINAAGMLASAGIPNLKLYFMIGLPLECDEDVDAMAGLVSRIQSARKGLGRLIINITPFVPKGGTAFEKALFNVGVLKSRGKEALKQLRKIKGVTVKLESIRSAEKEYRLGHAETILQ